MKIQLLILLLCLFFVQSYVAQENDGVVAFNIPVRNSLTFNRYLLNPTFSFVREQTKFISISNKREWVQFEDAPQTYIANFGGRFAENIGAGISAFQQNYGVLTTFGGVVNFAYNARLGRSSNLTFGLNVGAYQSGVNTSNVIVNFVDPALQNVQENFLLTVNPGVNFGTEFFDFGVSIQNLALYNFESSSLIENNPEQGIQAHMMYTGYMNTRGFFDNTKFTGLVRSQFLNEETIVSGLAMLTVPKGIWAQAGYNSVFGLSGGLGLNITEQIALEYNYERAIGDLSVFGPSHEITIAYRFKPNRYLNYSNDDEVVGLISTGNKKRFRRVSNSRRKNTKSTSTLTMEERAEAAKLAREKREAKKALLAKQALETEQKKEEEARVKAQAEAQKLAEEKMRQEAQLKAELAAKRKAKELAEEKARLESERLAKLAAEQKAKKEAKAKAEAKRLAEEKARLESEKLATLAAEQKAKEEAEAKRLIEEKARKEAEKLAKLAAEQKAKEEAEARKLAEEQRLEKLQAEKEAKADSIKNLISNPKDRRTRVMYDITENARVTSEEQSSLLKKLDSMVLVKDADLKALKEENDLSEQGIAVQPRPFKSISAENNRLNAIKTDLEEIITERNRKIKELEELYDETIIGDTLTNDEVMLFYRKEIKRLKSEQARAIETKERLNSQLETIKIATEFERRRRIKRAAFDNEEERYSQDRAQLQNIVETTIVANTRFNEDDFDFGEDQGTNIKILKNINRTENGFYMIMAVHSSIEKRDEFLTKVVASGYKNVDFFYDVNTSKYYIYYQKHNSISEATKALDGKGDQPYNAKMSIVKIEN